MFLALMLAAAQPTAVKNDPLLIDLVAGEDGQHCLADRQICFALPAASDSGELPADLMISFPASGDPGSEPLPLPALSGEAQELRLWPHLIGVPRGDRGGPDQGLEYMVGIIAEQRAMYSGGGGSGQRLHLLRFGMAPHAVGFGGEVLDVPWDSSLMIRACFSEQDMKDRLEACHDEYDYKASLSAAADDGGELPALTYRSVATAYPRTSRRSEDNSAKPLKKGDLTHWQDDICSYERLLRFNPATARYEMDRPVPDCSDYTTP
jgi:hypothetical protein